MSPPHFQDNHAIQRDSNHHQIMINRDSRFIKKSSSSLQSSSAAVINGVAAAIARATAGPHQPRHPVIIYTHSPKVIRTHPKDFMALVQKLTGFSPPASPPSSSPPPPPQPEPEPEPEPCDEYIITEITNNNTDHSSSNTNNNHNSNHEITAENNGLINEDKDSTSVVMDEKEGSCSVGHGFDPQNNSNNSFDNNEFINNKNNNKNSMPYFHPASTDFLCSGPPFGNCGDSLLLMRSSISSSLGSVRDLPDF